MEGVIDTLQLSNPRDDAVAPVVVPALADPRSPYLRIPAQVCRQLGLEVLETRDVRLADGSYAIHYYVGPIVVHAGNRTGFMGALVQGDAVRLGTLAIDELDLCVDARDGTVDVHPDSPHIARGVASRPPPARPP